MCGLAGKCVTHGDVTASEVREALDTIVHRGPDGHGIWTGPGIGLGHVRLSILDLSDLAAQPMVSADGRYVLVFNGEIYNFRDLRDELAVEGIQLESTGDTEVVVAQIARYGVAATLPKLEGDWAVAVWDTRDRLLTLARDVHGVKPLYYAHSGGSLAFGSELKAVAAFAGAAFEPSLGAVNAALLGYSVTWGERTLYRGVRAVRPGEQLTYDPAGDTLARRWFARLTDWVDDASYRALRAAPAAEVLRRTEESIVAGVRSRLVSDAPLACLASGGIDSSLIATLAAAERPGLPLYHADVANDSERPAAEALARALGLPLRTVRVTDADIVASIPDVTWHNDGPLIYHLNALPFYAVCQLAAKDGIKVLLTGEGSDEYLIGYPQDALRPVTDLVDRLKGIPRSWLFRLSSKATGLLWPHPADTYERRLLELSSAFEDARLIRTSWSVVGAGSRRDRRSRAMSLEAAQSHLVSLLHRNDRLGMAWGLEARFPFLAPEFARLAVNLPDRYKLRRTLRPHDRRHPFIVDKWAIRKVAAKRLPEALSARPKRGFPVSLAARLAVSEAFFAGGFVADLYALDRDTVAMTAADGPSPWLTRLVLLEVWGQLFFQKASRDQVRAHLLRHTSVTN